MIRDLNLAARALMRRPGLLVVAVVSLALGIGVNVAVFSVVNSALLKPLPYRDSDRIAVVWHTFGTGQSLPAVHPKDVRDYKERSRRFEDFTLIGGFETLFQAKGDPELVRVGNVAANFFTFLGVDPVLGRHFLPSDDLPGSARVVWLDYDLWQRHFGADPGVIGRIVKLDGVENEVVGVLPKGFELFLPSEAFFVKRPQIWKPARIDFARLPPRNWTAWTGLGRMKKGVTLDQARQEMAALGAQLRAEVPEFQAGDLRVGLIPLEEDVVKQVRGGLWALMGAVCFVLLIACANVARLLLARGFTREPEFRMRAALGATRLQLARSVMAEGFVISVGGAFIGVLIAQASLQVLRTVQAAAIPRLNTVRLDFGVLGFAVGAVLVATFVSAIVPGLRAARAVACPGPVADARSTGSAHRHRLQDRLVIGQVALAVVVVVGTGFMIRSFRALIDVPLGFEPRGMLTLRLALPRAQYPDAAAAREFYRQLEERLKGLPGVVSMAGMSRMVLSGAGPLQTFAYDEETARNWESRTADYREVSPGFFQAMGGTIVSGREFEDADAQEGAPRRLVIDTLLAQQAFPGRDAVGQRLQLEPEGRPSDFAEVIGVVAPLSLQGIVATTMPQLFQPGIYTRMRSSVLIRTTGDPKDLVAAVRREVNALSRDAAVQEVRTMDEVVFEALLPTRLAAGLMSVFGVVSVLLAGLGIYAALAYSVSQRIRELGIRIALGETPRSLKTRVLSQGLRLVGISLCLGTLVSAALSASARVTFYGVHWTDPVAYAGAIVLLVAVAMTACWIPAARAARVDPLRALRHE
ncbi:MAG: ABC transporter permease [Vicinamibacteria bacterium]|nr:ABC transporter permease [Vicinamibacteria bacterium]